MPVIQAPLCPRIRYKTLGHFSKAIDSGVSLNFCTSGGKYCDRRCLHHPRSTAHSATRQCYAVRSERRFDRKELLRKLLRHENMDPAEIVLKAIHEIQESLQQEGPIGWLRISTNGSVPGPEQATPRFMGNMRILLAFCKEHNIPVHLPVETLEKARFYRERMGDLVVVRHSAGTLSEFLNTPGAIAFTVGDQRQSRTERLEEARAVAAAKRAMSGRWCHVCPAIAMRYANDNKPNPKAKCGRCVACARPNAGVVYPLH